MDRGERGENRATMGELWARDRWRSPHGLSIRPSFAERQGCRCSLTLARGWGGSVCRARPKEPRHPCREGTRREGTAAPGGDGPIGKDAALHSPGLAGGWMGEGEAPMGGTTPVPHVNARLMQRPLISGTKFFANGGAMIPPIGRRTGVSALVRRAAAHPSEVRGLRHSGPLSGCNSKVTASAVRPGGEQPGEPDRPQLK